MSAHDHRQEPEPNPGWDIRDSLDRLTLEVKKLRLFLKYKDRCGARFSNSQDPLNEIFKGCRCIYDYHVSGLHRAVKGGQNIMWKDTDDAELQKVP